MNVLDRLFEMTAFGEIMADPMSLNHAGSIRLCITLYLGYQEKV